MNLKLGTRDAEKMIDELRSIFPRIKFDVDVRSGVYLDIEPVSPESTDDQREGFHLLIGEWLRMDPRITISAEDLKDAVCRAMWGVVRLVGPGGQDRLIAARRTTRKWDHDRKRYVRAALSREDYSALIEFTYGMAAQDGVVLPELERERTA